MVPTAALPSMRAIGSVLLLGLRRGRGGFDGFGIGLFMQNFVQGCSRDQNASELQP